MSFLKRLFSAPDVEKLKAENNYKGLVNLLAKKDEGIRNEAAEALVEIGPPAIDDLVSSVGHRNEQKKSKWPQC